MDIKFHKTVAKQKLNDGTKQVVQTVESPKESYFERERAKAKAFLEKLGITETKGVYGAPLEYSENRQ
jgi:hypothetical protein